MANRSGKTNLTHASRQWAERPADQRFWNLQDLYDRTKLYAEESRVHEVALSDCNAAATKADDIVLVGPSGTAATFQNYSFGQLSSLCKAPASYLQTLPAPVAADCLNHGLRKLPGSHNLLFHQNGGLELRCVTSKEYKRIWNYEIAELALALQSEGWRVPPARPCGLPNVPVRIATEADVLKNSSHPGLGINVGDQISPAGLYASDRDCFIFQVNEDYGIDGGDGETMYRGVFWTNSEVGDRKFRGTMFLYDSVCGNHIVWGARVVAEIEIRHTGAARDSFREAMATVTERVQVAASEDEDRIRLSKSHQLGDGREDVINLVFRKNIGLSKAQCEDAMILAERHEDDHGGNPLSAWGYAAGVTRLSQGVYADQRDTMDRAAGRILEFAF